MNNPYDVHTWTKQYREDVLHEVQVQRLAEQARKNRTPAGERVRLAWASLISLLLSALEEYDMVTNRRP
jgi:hypothetical protein